VICNPPQLITQNVYYSLYIYLSLSVSIAKYFLARSLYDSLAQWNTGSSNILENEQYVISPGEFQAQHIEIETSGEAKISARVKRGQDVQLAVTDKGDFEWAMKEGEELNPAHKTVVGKRQEDLTVDLHKGKHTIYMEPAASEGKSSQIELTVGPTSGWGSGGLLSSDDNKLDKTGWLVLVLVLSPFGYLSSLGAFFTFLSALGSLSISASIGGLIVYLMYITPLLFGVYFDARKTRRVSDFPKNLRKYMVIFLLPVVNILGLILYVRRRGKVQLRE